MAVERTEQPPLSTSSTSRQSILTVRIPRRILLLVPFVAGVGAFFDGNRRLDDAERSEANIPVLLARSYGRVPASPGFDEMAQERRQELQGRVDQERRLGKAEMGGGFLAAAASAIVLFRSRGRRLDQ